MFEVRKSEDPRYIAIASSTTMCDCSLKNYIDVDRQIQAMYPEGVKGHVLYDMLCSLGPNHTRFYDQTYNTKTDRKRCSAINGTGKPVTERKVGDELLEAQLRFYARDFSTLKSRSVLTQDYINKMIDQYETLTKSSKKSKSKTK